MSQITLTVQQVSHIINALTIKPLAAIDCLYIDGYINSSQKEALIAQFTTT